MERGRRRQLLEADLLRIDPERESQITGRLLERRDGIGPHERIARMREPRGQRIACEFEHLRGRRRLAEERRRGLGQLMGLVEDDRVRGRQQIGDPFVAQHEVGEEQVMIDDDEVGLLRRAPRLHHEALRVMRTFGAEAVLARRRHQRPDRRVLGHLRELGAIAAAGRQREALDRAQMHRVLARHEATVVARAGEMLVADVVGASLQQRDGDGRPQRRADQRDVLAKQLVLQRLRAGRHDHLAAPQHRRHEIRERLAGPGAGLGDQRPAALDGIGDGLGHLDLAIARPIAVDLVGERSVGGEDAGQRGTAIGGGG